MIAIRLPRVTLSADASCAIVAFSGVHRVSQQTHLAVRTHDDYRHAEAMLWGRLPHDEVLDAVAALADVYDAFVEEHTAPAARGNPSLAEWVTRGDAVSSLSTIGYAIFGTLAFVAVMEAATFAVESFLCARESKRARLAMARKRSGVCDE